jgi:hypothetical protein
MWLSLPAASLGFAGADVVLLGLVVAILGQPPVDS